MNEPRICSCDWSEAGSALCGLFRLLQGSLSQHSASCRRHKLLGLVGRLERPFQGVPVVDCTAYVTAVHQNHGYAPHPDGKGGTHLGPLAMQNYQLAGGPEHFRWMEDATHRLSRDGHISRRVLRLRYRTKAKDLRLQVQRILTYKIRLPLWSFSDLISLGP